MSRDQIDKLTKELKTLEPLILWHTHQDKHNTSIIMEAVESRIKDALKKYGKNIVGEDKPIIDIPPIGFARDVVKSGQSGYNQRAKDIKTRSKKRWGVDIT